MIPAITSVQPLEGHRLQVAFDDGVVCLVDLSDDLWGPMFEPLRDPELFGKVRADPEGHTVTWPNGADIDPLVLHGDYPPSPPSRLRVDRVSAGAA